MSTSWLMFGFSRSTSIWSSISLFRRNCIYDSAVGVGRLVPVMVDDTFVILYGSQTGQAKAIAEEIYEQSESHDLRAKLFCLSTTDKKFSLERESVVVFVVSTTGDGEPPDTVGKFWRRIRKKTLDKNHFKELRYTLLGLGDTNYTNFCNCSKTLNSRLKELGATHFYPPGFADDAVGLEVVIEPWIEGLWPVLKKALNSDSQISVNCTSDRDETDQAIPSDQNPPMTTCDENSIGDSARATSAEQFNSKTVQDSSNINGSNSNIPDEDKNQTSSEDHQKPSLRTSVPPLSGCDLSIPMLPEPYLSIEFNDETSLDTSSLPWQGGAEFPGNASPFTRTNIVLANQMTRGDAVKTALCVTFDTGDATLDYIPGDSFGVLCPNDEKEVDDLIVRLGYKDEENTVFTVEAKESAVPKKRAKGRPEYIPHLCTIKHALSTCLEIRGVPRKALLRVLCECTTDPKEKRRLQELCSKQGTDDYAKFIREPHVSFHDIINAFPSCKPPFERVIEHLPRLLPRPYSVSCSPLENPRRLRIVFNIVKFSRIDNVRGERSGVCTAWLQRLARRLMVAEGNTVETIQSNIQELSLDNALNSMEVYLYRRKSTGFHLPQDPRCPVIMIGPGTGVAPFIGFLQHRQYQQRQASEDATFGAMWLFYGCRHKDRDFLFRDELSAFEKNGVLTKLLVSFSRDISTQNLGEPETPKYVQDNVRTCGSDLCDLIYNCGAYIYVCGDAKNMAKNVLESFINVLEKVKGLEYKEAQKEIWRLRQEQRYVEDVWT